MHIPLGTQTELMGDVDSDCLAIAHRIAIGHSQTDRRTAAAQREGIQKTSCTEQVVHAVQIVDRTADGGEASSLSTRGRQLQPRYGTDSGLYGK